MPLERRHACARRELPHIYVVVKGTDRTPRSGPGGRGLCYLLGGLVAGAGCRYGLAELGGELAFGGSEGVDRDNFESANHAVLASPSMSDVVYVELMTVWVRLLPVFEGRLCGSSPVVYGFAGLGA